MWNCVISFNLSSHPHVNKIQSEHISAFLWNNSGDLCIVEESLVIQKYFYIVYLLFVLLLQYDTGYGAGTGQWSSLTFAHESDTAFAVYCML